MAGELASAQTGSKPPRPGVCKSSYWTRLIAQKLQQDQGHRLAGGRFDPHTIFKNIGELDEFYSGHPVHPDQIKINHDYARWAIANALREYLPDSEFQIAKEIMTDKSVIVRAGKTKALKEISERIKAEGQHEIDLEDPNESRVANGEMVQRVRSVAQTVISASPNCLGPPIHACAMYLRMEKFGEYGRNKLSVWRSYLLPGLGWEDGSKGLLDNQITAIVWILSRFLGELPRLLIKSKDQWDEKKQRYIQRPETDLEKENRKRLRGPKYFGGILADSMGLGKTLATIATLELMASQRINVAVEDDKMRYRPMLILTPNSIVAAQWVDEIEQIKIRRGIKQIILSSGEKKRRENKVYDLTYREFTKNWPRSLSWVWDEDDPNASKAVIIVSIDTWAGRTCFNKENDEGEIEWFSTFGRKGRKFSVVVVDEAYKIRNSATRNWKSVALLDRTYTLLITATPCMNNISDLLGPVRLLWRGAESHLETLERWSRVKSSFTEPCDLERLDAMQPWDDMQLVAGRPALLTRLIQQNRSRFTVDIQEIRSFLKYFESLAILRRAPSSYLYLDWEKTKPVSLEGLLPEVGNFTVNIQCGHAFSQAYQETHIDLLIDYMKTINKWKRNDDSSDLKPILTTHRHFELAAASLDVYRLERLFSLNGFGTMAPHVLVMRGTGVNLMSLTPFLLEPEDPEPRVALDYVKLAVRKSPVLRYILHYVKENILSKGPNGKIKKLLITEASPMLALYYEIVLKFLFIHCRTLHSGLSADERRELIADFNDDSDHSCQIMIQMYTVGFAGSNLHKNCARVLVASQAYSLAVQWQAVHRVIRVGQNCAVKVHRIKVKNSYHSFRESRQIDKILPELGTRAQGPMNDMLVKLLNLYQHEIDEAWRSPEAQKLVVYGDLATDPLIKEEGQANKRIKLEVDIASGVSTNKYDTAKSDPNVYTLRHKSDKSDSTTRYLFDKYPKDFLALKTRGAYYEEFKNFPREVKGRFCHKKNNLRRMLSYGSPANNATTRVWSVKDLDDSAVLERAMELMLRIRLGASTIEMLPLPQIDLPLAPPDKLEQLAALLGEARATDQDVETARRETEAKSRSPTDKGLQILKQIPFPMSLDGIDSVLSDDVKSGSTKSTRRQQKAAKDGKMASKSTDEPVGAKIKRETPARTMVDLTGENTDGRRIDVEWSDSDDY